MCGLHLLRGKVSICKYTFAYKIINEICTWLTAHEMTRARLQFVTNQLVHHKVQRPDPALLQDEE